MYGIYANIGGILMGSMLPYIAYMDPMGYIIGWIAMCVSEKPNSEKRYIATSEKQIWARQWLGIG